MNYLINITYNDFSARMGGIFVTYNESLVKMDGFWY